MTKQKERKEDVSAVKVALRKDGAHEIIVGKHGWTEVKKEKDDSIDRLSIEETVLEFYKKDEKERVLAELKELESVMPWVMPIFRESWEEEDTTEKNIYEIIEDIAVDFKVKRNAKASGELTVDTTFYIFYNTRKERQIIEEMVKAAIQSILNKKPEKYEPYI
jgi:hypothetical protein